ncbi:MAG: aspartate--tRNA ligase, partial [Parcubacteria group bacterium]|nr:aspartate--tRNA ligase [Parcubacteria group bacterium]
FERYFQIARCIRDEDLRADRSFEHTQLDMEMSFVTRDEVMACIEELMTGVVEGIGYTVAKKPFPQYSYPRALAQFGADKFDLRTPEEKKSGVLAFAWVTDFPLFEKTENGAWTYSHNPFTGVHPEDEEKLLSGKDIGIINSLQYDLVCNGHELGSGSIRASKPDILEKVFEVIGYPPERIHAEFGHMLRAFVYGVPPHGGIGLGIDRFAALLAGESSIREIQAFPTTARGNTAVMDAPSAATPEQLHELGLAVRPPQGD